MSSAGSEEEKVTGSNSSRALESRDGVTLPVNAGSENFGVGSAPTTPSRREPVTPHTLRALKRINTPRRRVSRFRLQDPFQQLRSLSRVLVRLEKNSPTRNDRHRVSEPPTQPEKEEQQQQQEFTETEGRLSISGDTGGIPPTLYESSGQSQQSSSINDNLIPQTASTQDSHDFEKPNQDPSENYEFHLSDNNSEIIEKSLEERELQQQFTNRESVRLETTDSQDEAISVLQDQEAPDNHLDSDLSGEEELDINEQNEGTFEFDAYPSQTEPIFAQTAGDNFKENLDPYDGESQDELFMDPNIILSNTAGIPSPINIGDETMTIIELPGRTAAARQRRRRNASINSAQRRARNKKIETAVPRRVVKDITKMISASRILPEAFDEILSVSNMYFEQTMKDLTDYAQQSNRRTIESQDVVRLLHSQRLIHDHQTTFSLAHKYLPAELLNAILSEAK